MGDEYLRIVSWNFVARGLVFVTSSMFQAMGNTLPSLVTSFVRVVRGGDPGLPAGPAGGLRPSLGVVLTVVSVSLQMVVSLILLRREFRHRLAFAPPTAAAPAAGLAN